MANGEELVDRKSDQQLFQARGFGRRIGFGEHPALIVIDFINAFTDPNMKLGSEVGPAIEQTNRLLEVAHRCRYPVYFSTVWYEEKDCIDAGVWSLKQAGVHELLVNTPAVELDSRLDRHPDDGLIVKKYASCFFATDLATRLQFRRVDTLVITGCTTSGCVRATAVDSVQNGFRPIVAREAVSDRSQLAHDQSLFDIDAKYGDVEAVDDIIRHLEQRNCKHD